MDVASAAIVGELRAMQNRLAQLEAALQRRGRP